MGRHKLQMRSGANLCCWQLLVGVGMLVRQALEWQEIKTIFDELFQKHGKVGQSDLTAEDFSMLFRIEPEDAEEIVFLADKDRFA